MTPTKVKEKFFEIAFFKLPDEKVTKSVLEHINELITIELRKKCTDLSLSSKKYKKILGHFLWAFLQVPDSRFRSKIYEESGTVGKPMRWSTPAD